MKGNPKNNLLLPLARLLLMLSLVGLVACGNQGEGGRQPAAGDYVNSDEALFIDLDRISEPSFYDYYTHVSLVLLETKDESVIRNANKVILTDSTIYLLDGGQRSLLLFNREGRYKGSVFRVGRGPGEYGLIYDFDINPYSGNIELLDPSGKLLVFDQELNHLETFRIDKPSTYAFRILNRDTLLLYHPFDSAKVSIYIRSEERIVRELLYVTDNSYDRPKSDGLTYQRLSNAGGRPVLFLPYSNKIYGLSEDINEEVITEWDFGKYNFREDMVERGQDIAYYIQLITGLKNQAASFYYYQENRDMIFTRFLFNRKWIHLYYDKETGLYDSFSSFKEEGLYPPITGFINDSIAIEVAEFDRLRVLFNEKILSPSQKEVLATISPEDNPVLLIYHLRQER